LQERKVGREKLFVNPALLTDPEPTA
jgi:hypothetical protein